MKDLGTTENWSHVDSKNYLKNSFNEDSDKLPSTTKILYYPDYHHDRVDTKNRPISSYTGAISKLEQFNCHVFIPKKRNLYNSYLEHLISVITVFPNLSNYDIVIAWLIPALFLGVFTKLFGRKTKLGLIAITPVSKPFTTIKKIKYYIIHGILKDFDFAICHSHIQKKQFSNGFGIHPDQVHEWILGIDVSFFGKPKPNYEEKTIELISHGDQSRDNKTLYKLATNTKLKIRRTSRHFSDTIIHYQLSEKYKGTFNHIKVDIGVKFPKIREWLRNGRISLILLEKGTDQPAGIISLLESMASMCTIIISQGAASFSYITHLKDGYVLPAEVNVNELSSIISKLRLTDIGEVLALNAYKKAIKCHTFYQSAKNLAFILENVTENVTRTKEYE